MTATTTTKTRPTGPNGWLVIGGIFTVLLVVTGALTAASWMALRTETQTHVYRQNATSIFVDIGTGDLTIAPGAPGQVSVQRTLHWSWSSQKPIIEERWDGPSLHVTGGCGTWFSVGNCGVDYVLEVPEGVSVQAHTSTGDVTVHNILGQLDLSTSTGNIRVTGATGTLRLDASTGHITAKRIESTVVDASTSTGDITLQFVTAPRTVTAQTSTGDVNVIVPSGNSYRIQTNTNTGHERVHVTRDDTSERSINASTKTGDIDIAFG